MEKHLTSRKPKTKVKTTGTYVLQQPDDGIVPISPDKSTTTVPVLQITPEVRKRAANLMDATKFSPGTMDYLEAEAGPLLDDQDYMEQPKTPKKKKLCRNKDKEGAKPRSPVKPMKQTEPNPPNEPEEEEPFFDRLVQYIIANKRHITGMTMQTISTNQWVTVNIKSDPEPEKTVIQLPDFVNQ